MLILDLFLIGSCSESRIAKVRTSYSLEDLMKIGFKNFMDLISVLLHTGFIDGAHHKAISILARAERILPFSILCKLNPGWEPLKYISHTN